MAEIETKNLEEQKKAHDKRVYKYPDGTILVYYQQELNKCTDVSLGFRIPRLDIPYDNEIIGTFKNKLVFYQNLDDELRIPLIKPGLPHFIEHMIYSSLPDMPIKEIYDYLARTNTEYNAFTSQDTLKVEFNCPSKFNDVIFDLYSRMIFRDQYNKKDLENEKNPVYQELEETIDETASELAGGENLLTSVLFSNNENLTGEELLGINKQIIQSFDEKQMLRFINAYFTKQNMIITVVSDRPFEQIKALCDRHFVEKAASNEATKVKTPEPVYSFNSDTLLLLQDPEAKTANMTFILKGLPDYEQNEIFSVVEDFILNNFNGRLMEKLRNENGKTYTPSFSEFNLPGLSVKYLNAQTTPNNVRAVLEIMIDILQDLATNGITDTEFEGFKEMWANRRERAVSVKHNRASILFDKVLHGLKPFVGEYNKKITELTKEDINNYFKNTYSHAKCCLAITGNFDQKKLLPFNKILKFRPLDKYMDEKYIDRKLENDFFEFLRTAQAQDFAKKIKYVKDESFKKYCEEKERQRQEAEKKKQEQSKNNAKEEKPTQEETSENVKKKNKQYYTVNKPNVVEGATEKKTKEHNRNSSLISPSTDIYNYYKLSNCTGDKEYNYYDISNRAANNKYFIEILEDLKK